ncbi:MAG: hypothetical protein ABJI18_09540, partial [Lentilitoribacter sp.]
IEVKIIATVLVWLFIGPIECLAQNSLNADISEEFEECVASVDLVEPNALNEVEACTEKAISNCLLIEGLCACFDELANEMRVMNESLILQLSQSGRNLSSPIGNIQYEYSKRSKICVQDFDEDTTSQCLLTNEMAQTLRLLNLIKHK